MQIAPRVPGGPELLRVGEAAYSWVFDDMSRQMSQTLRWSCLMLSKRDGAAESLAASIPVVAMALPSLLVARNF